MTLYSIDLSLAPILVMIGLGGRRFQHIGTEAVDVLEQRLGRYLTWLERVLA